MTTLIRGYSQHYLYFIYLFFYYYFFFFQGILALINSTLDPLLNAINMDLENFIFKMHAEDFTRWVVRCNDWHKLLAKCFWIKESKISDFDWFGGCVHCGHQPEAKIPEFQSLYCEFFYPWSPINPGTDLTRKVTTIEPIQHFLTKVEEKTHLKNDLAFSHSFRLLNVFCLFSSTLSHDIADSPDAPCSGYIQELQVRGHSNGLIIHLSVGGYLHFHFDE